MITRVEIDGFKSLRELAVDLEPFTVLIGPNSAGKSNFLDALALLSRLASRPIDEALKLGRGRPIDQFTRCRGEAGRVMSFAVEMLVGGTHPDARKEGVEPEQNRFRYEIVIERQSRVSGSQFLSIRDERLRAIERSSDAWIQERSELASDAGYAMAGGYLITRHGDDKATREGRLVPRVFPEDEERLRTQSLLAANYSGRAALAQSELAGYRLLRLDTVRLREPSDRVDTGALAPDASNLPTFLADLPAVKRGEILADLVSLVPGISSFDVVPEEDSFRIELESSGGERLPARIVSDGTLRILALLASLRGQPRPRAIGIEEPENGVYPGRLRLLLELLQEETTRGHDEEALGRVHTRPLPTQIILTTHSPVVLAALRSQPKHLRFVDLVRRDGQLVTRVRTVGPSTAPDRGRLTISPREIDRLLNAGSDNGAE